MSARDQSPVKAGAVLNHGDYEALKRRWLDLAAERGYADAQFTANRIDVYPEQRVADIVLHFDSGKRYRFGAISFQQDVLSDDLIHSYVKIRRGDPYDGRELNTLYTALANSGYFRNIEVRPQPADRDSGEIPVDIVLAGAKRRNISYGVGYSTDTGPRFRFSRNNRRVNEEGHQFGITAQISPLVSELTANYRMPINDPRSDWLGFDAGVKSEHTETADSDSLQIGVRRLTRREHDWYRMTMLSFLVEDFTVGAESGRAQLLMPGVDWTRCALRQHDPSESWLEARARGARRGRRDPVRLELRAGDPARQVDLVAVGPSQRILFRSELGAMYDSDFARLPPSVRFFAGGDNSIRGYDYNTLGPDGLRPAKSSAAPSSRSRASSTSTRFGRIGRWPYSSTPATRSIAARSRRRPAPESARAGCRRSVRSASTSRTRSKTRRTRGVCTSRSGPICEMAHAHARGTARARHARRRARRRRALARRDRVRHALGVRARARAHGPGAHDRPCQRLAARRPRRRGRAPQAHARRARHPAARAPVEAGRGADRRDRVRRRARVAGGLPEAAAEGRRGRRRRPVAAVHAATRGRDRRGPHHRRRGQRARARRDSLHRHVLRPASHDLARAELLGIDVARRERRHPLRQRHRARDRHRLGRPRARRGRVRPRDARRRLPGVQDPSQTCARRSRRRPTARSTSRTRCASISRSRGPAS